MQMQVQRTDVDALMPEVTGDFETYEFAQRLVKDRNSIDKLTNLVNFFLVQNTRLRALSKESVKYYSIADFEGDKGEWLERANALKVFE